MFISNIKFKPTYFAVSPQITEIKGIRTPKYLIKTLLSTMSRTFQKIRIIGAVLS